MPLCTCLDLRLEFSEFAADGDAHLSVLSALDHVQLWLTSSFFQVSSARTSAPNFASLRLSSTSAVTIFTFFRLI